MLHHALGLIVAGLCVQGGGPELPEVVVDRDDVVVDRSCRIVIPPGTVIRDEAGDGVIKLRTGGVTIEFAPGSVLRGSPAGGAPDEFSGVGIRIDDAESVTLRGARVEGFKAGVWATTAHGLVVEDCRGDDLWRQRLRSTPGAEEQSDWLWPHKNDANEWLTNYGAAMCIEDSDGVTVRRCTVRRGQNGLILDRVCGSKVYDNDFSFLSGWGLAMWRSSGNTVSRNALDFCVRGYSHGVYNRGQDSAGLLVFEQCSDNLFVENSATHGGDGFFGFGGHLGEKSEDPEQYKGRGCNRNRIIANDFSYATAHGIEMTFSFGNRIVANRLAENAICGIWGGYSQDTIIHGNTITGNGLPARGEGGGINIEHGAGNVIRENTFESNTVGVALWFDADEGLMATPWAVANHRRPGSCTIQRNVFHGDATALRLTDAGEVALWSNTHDGVEEWLRTDGATRINERDDPGGAAPVVIPEVPGDSSPVGARSHLGGRDKIIMGQWGPWDHESVLVRRGAGSGSAHAYEFYGLSEEPAVSVESEGVRAQVTGDGALKLVRIEVSSADGAGVRPYRVHVRGNSVPAESRLLTGTLVSTAWEVVFFPWTVDPREDHARWRAESLGPRAARLTTPALALPFAHRGPDRFVSAEDRDRAALWNERFGTIATTTLHLPAGRYRFTTLSDDGVRVRVLPEGAAEPSTIIDNWTWHAPTRDTAEFTQTDSGDVTITVEHFELDGYAVLELEIEAVD